MRTLVEGILRLWERPNVRRAVNGASIGIALAVGVLAGKHFADAGWPLRNARTEYVVGAGLLFLVAYAFKAWGWNRLFAPNERPGPFALAAATGAASLTGIALPGRLDDVVRVAVVRKYPGCVTGCRALGLSLFTLGLIDTIALTPLASVGAALTSASPALKAGLAIVAFAGLGAGGIVIALPRLKHGRLFRFRVVRWVAEHAPSNREAAKALAFVAGSWVIRMLAIFLLLGALGLGLSMPLAIVFLCAGAASAALPVAPAGAATQAGAGAAILVASGVGTSSAIAFAIAAQALVIMAGAAVVFSIAAWHGGARLVALRGARAVL
jgi:lysylphosphatidylglycerol synthase-like protein